MNKIKIKDEIVKGIKIAQEKLQYTLVSEDWGGEKFKCACAIGCLLVSKGIPISSDIGDNIVQAEKILQVHDNWVYSFITGFDDCPAEEESNKEALALGQEIRDELKPVRGDLYMTEWFKEQERVAAGD